jgi:hypothetical protein
MEAPFPPMRITSKTAVPIQSPRLRAVIFARPSILARHLYAEWDRPSIS